MNALLTDERPDLDEGPATRGGSPPRVARTLPEQIADELGTALIAGEYAVGQRLREQELADRYAVSRGPVREALRLLDRRGMVRLIPRRGAHVREQNLDAIADLFNVRTALSALAAHQAALRPVASYVEALARRVAEMEALVDALDGPTHTTVNAPAGATGPMADTAAQAATAAATQRDAHARDFASVTTRAVRAIVKASGNVHAAALMDELSEQTVWRAIWTWPLDYTIRERRQTQAAHFRRVLGALEGGDAHAAEHVLRLALEESRDIAVATLARLRGEQVDAVVRLLRTADQARRSRA